MTWHKQPRSERVSWGSLALCMVLAACGSSSKNATISITAPTKGQVLTVKEDVSSSKDGVQYNVTASSSGIASGTEVVLRISDVGDAPVTKVAGDGAIEFEAVTLPPGKHTLRVVTATGGVESAEDYDYTLKAIVIERPQDRAQLGYADDKDPNTDGIQINVSVSTYEIELSEDVTLKVDDTTYGSAQHPNANGKLVFSGVTLAEGDHKLKVIAGDAESEVVSISVSTACATAMFVTPDPPTDGSAVKLGGGDKCPKNGEPFKTDFTVSTDAGDGRDVDLVVNGTLVASTKVNGTLAKFTDVVLDRYKTANKVSVVVQGAQLVTCNPIPYPSDILVDCEGVDCSISAPQPVAGNDSTGKRVLYLNQSKKGKDGFEFEVHTIADAIGQPVKLIIDGKDTDVPTADPSGSDPDVKAKFSALQLTEGEHNIQARCELKNGSVGLSRVANWIVDTKPCEVDIKQPSADTLLSSSIDTDKNLGGVQTEISSNVTGSDCSASRAAVCDPMSGISDKVGYDGFDGSPLTSTVTLTNDASQTLCVEVQDRAGNVGRDSVGVRFNVEAPKLVIESPANNDKYNSAGGGDYKADTDTGSADVCNANFDVACSQLGAAVKLHRDNATGTVFGMANCEAKGNNDPALPAGYAGRARIKNAAFLPNNADNVKVVATQAVTAGGKELVGESAAITVKGDCQKPSLKFSQDPCGGGQLAVNTAQDMVSKNIVAEESTTDTQKATLTVTSGGSQFSMKEVNVGNNGNFDFGSVNLGGPGSGKRTITIEASAKDDYENTGKVSCNADIVYDLPTLMVTAPADNAVLVIPTGLCTPTSGGMYGVTIAATADQANNRSASYSVGTGSDSALTLNGTAISGCVPIVEGSNDVHIKLTSTVTTATNTVTRKVTLVGMAPANGITLNAPTLPGDRNGKVTLTWTLPTETVSGQFAKYELRCDPQAIAMSATTPEKDLWWTNAKVMTLPTDFNPPTATVQLDFRVGENNNCVLRALDAANQGTPIVQSTAIQVPFRVKSFTPAAGGNWAGWDLAAAGEVSGDNRSDLLVGGGGAAYLVFGADDLNAHSATPDVTFIGRPDGYFAADVAGIGDFNGDGRADIAIGDSQFNSTAGRVLIFYGRAAATDWGTLPATITIGDNCVADVCLNGPTASFTGAAVSAANDFDGDGRADLAIGAPGFLVGGNQAGRVYVVRGKELTSGSVSAGQFHNQAITLDTDPAVEGFTLTGVGAGAGATRFLGQSVVGIGASDNAAGDDLVVSGPGDSNAINGGVWFVSGRVYQSGAGLIPLASIVIDTGMDFGSTVFAVGNVLNVGATTGKVDVGVFNALDTGFYLYTGDTSFAAASKVFVNSRRQYYGEFVGAGRTLGDLDGDGISEVLMCGESDPATGSAPGVPYLFYSDTFGRKLGTSNLIFTDNGSPLSVSAGTGVVRRTVEFVGDLNGDGKNDLAVGGTPRGDATTNLDGEFSILY